jgi:DNA repair protein RadA/Sms
MILAVLETRCGLVFGNKDVYLNVTGGLKITEPAADLAVAASLLSALKNKPVPEGAVLFGEVGLGGEVRAVNQLTPRLKEAGKLGFSQAFFAKPHNKQQALNKHSLSEKHLTFLVELLNYFSN